MKRRIICMLLVFVLMLPCIANTSVYAAITEVKRGSFESFLWSINLSGKLAISNNDKPDAKMPDFKIGSRPWEDYIEDITSVNISNSNKNNGNIKNIGENAFAGCIALTEVSFLHPIESIGNNAFAGCISLEEIEIPDSVQIIGTNAFSECSSLISINIPKSVKSLGQSPFINCQLLNTISVDAENEYYTSIDNVLFSKDEATLVRLAPANIKNTYEISEKVSVIAPYAFAGNTTLSSLTIHDELDEISENAFKDCTSFNSVIYKGTYDSFSKLIGKDQLPENIQCDSVIEGNCGSNANFILENDGTLKISGSGSMTNFQNPQSAPWHIYKDKIKAVYIESDITSIGDFSFYDCDNLSSITLPETITSIGTKAFWSCDTLTKISIPSSVTLIGKNAFSKCTSLSEISVNALNTVYSSAGNVLYDINKTTLIQYAASCDITDFNMPDTVTTIYSYAFSDAKNLKSIHISEKIELIEEYAFEGCDFDIIYYIASANWEKVNILTPGNDVLEDTDIIDFTYTHSGSCGDSVIWSLSKNGTLTLSGTGNMYDYSSFNETPWNECTADVKELVIKNGITSIGDSSFSDFINLTDVHLGIDLISIGTNAFNNCNNMTNLYVYAIPLYNKINKKSGNTPLDDASIYFDVEDFGYCGDEHSETLTWTVDIAGTLKIDGAGNMKEYSSLSEIPWNYLAGNIKKIEIGKDVKQLCDAAFSNCVNALSITVDPGNTSFTASDNILYNYEKNKILLYLNTKTEENYVIGNNISSIAPYAFYQNTHIKSLTVYPSLKSIGINAFSGSNVSNINYNGTPEEWNKTEISDGNDCIKYSSVIYLPRAKGELDNGLKWSLDYYNKLTISGENIAIPDFSYSVSAPWEKYSDYIETINIANGITVIGSFSFHGLDNLTEITLPDSATTIKSNALCECDLIESVTITKGVSDIENGAFYDCNSLENINVDPLNTVYESENGIVYTKNKASLIQYPSGKEERSYNMPSSVNYIASMAFHNCIALESITVSSALTKLENDTFKGCDYIRSVSIPVSITTIGESCFNDCTVSEVYYTGTPEQWNNIKIDRENKCIKNAYINFVKPQHTRTIVNTTQNEKIYTVSPVDIPYGSKVIISVYQTNGVTDLKITTYNGECITYASPSTNGNAKIIVWEKNSCTPITITEIK